MGSSLSPAERLAFNQVVEGSNPSEPVSTVATLVFELAMQTEHADVPGAGGADE